MTNTPTSSAEVQKIVAYLEYSIGNPSAWDSFDDTMSDRLRFVMPYIRSLEADHKAMREEIERAVEIFSDEAKGRGLSVYGANGLKRLQAVIPSLQFHE